MPINLPPDGQLTRDQSGAKTYSWTTSMWAWMRDVTALLSPATGGIVTSVTATPPIASSGGTTPNISHNNSGVAAATYGDSTHVPQIAVNATGHITSASNVAIVATGTVTHTGTLTSGQLIQGNGGADITVNATTATVTKLTAGVPSAATPGTDYTNLAFKTISVSGQSDIVADSAADMLTVVAGTNITITTDASTDTLTIAATSGGTSGGSTLIGYDRLTGDGATTVFNLADTAEYLLDVSDAGAIVDPTLLTLTGSGTTVTFSSAPTAAHVLTFEYAVAQL